MTPDEIKIPREVVEKIRVQAKTCGGIAALIKHRGYKLITAEDQIEAWRRQKYQLNKIADEALALLAPYLESE